MEYFQLISEATNIPKPTLFSDNEISYRMSKKHFDEMPKSQTCYYETAEDQEIPELMNHPTFLCGRELKHIIEVYDPDIQWKNLFFLPSKMDEMTEKTLEYSIPSLTEQNCLHEDCVIYPNGELEKLILNGKKIRNMDIFQVEGTAVNYVIVSLPLAESISRRNLYGIKLERVEIRYHG